MPDIVATIIVSSTPGDQHIACGVLGEDDTAECFLINDIVPVIMLSRKRGKTVFLGLALCVQASNLYNGLIFLSNLCT